MNAFNSFEKPDVVKPAAFNGFTLKDGILSITMPSKSVVVFELTK
jgi:alpha-N-arabinofuranosidase